MKIVAINYADSKFKDYQLLNSKFAVKFGKVDSVFSYTPDDIAPSFYNENKSLLSRPRGGGCWLWKPYFLKIALNSVSDGDYIVYTDSGSYFICNPIKPLIDEMSKEDRWLLVQSTSFSEQQYTKRDTFILMGCDSPEYAETNQYTSGLYIIKKCDDADIFADLWLTYTTDSRILTDDPNVCGRDNYVGFLDHRYDQSIFSLLCKKLEISPFEPILCSIYKKINYNVIYYHHHSKSTVTSVKLLVTFIHSVLSVSYFCYLKDILSYFWSRTLR